jgi:hypothetical protein
MREQIPRWRLRGRGLRLLRGQCGEYVVDVRDELSVSRILSEPCSSQTEEHEPLDDVGGLGQVVQWSKRSLAGIL